MSARRDKGQRCVRTISREKFQHDFLFPDDRSRVGGAQLQSSTSHLKGKEQTKNSTADNSISVKPFISLLCISDWPIVTMLDAHTRNDTHSRTRHDNSLRTCADVNMRFSFANASSREHNTFKSISEHVKFSTSTASRLHTA